MAFQDNCGTIILDAVLTDVGRKRLTQGNFKVTKFLLGDDEIDYSLIDMDSEDFSNVVAQPLYEAYGAEKANITYGLVSYPSDDIIYIPDIQVNTKLINGIKPYSSRANLADSYIVAANSETAKKIKSITSDPRCYLENNNISNLKLYIESGINLQSGLSIPRDKTARERYIINTGLMDGYYAVSCDSRFVETILTSKPSAYFNNDGNGKLYYNSQPLKRRTKTSLASPVEMYETYIVPAVGNHIYNIDSTGKDTQHSMFDGPRSTIFAMNVKLIDKMTSPSGSATVDIRYKKFGKVDQTPFGGSNKFDVIDTVIYIEGLSTSSRLQIPIKIMRYSGT